MLKEELQYKINNRESFVVAHNGQFLGVLTSNKQHPEAVTNELGPYGNPFSSTSIFNRFGLYGGKFSSMSPFNPYTQTPPIIYLRGIKIGPLSVNQILYNRIDPHNLFQWIEQEGL